MEVIKRGIEVVLFLRECIRMGVGSKGIGCLDFFRAELE